jgi:hypothetical protein
MAVKKELKFFLFTFLKAERMLFSAFLVKLESGFSRFLSFQIPLVKDMFTLGVTDSSVESLNTKLVI